MKKGDRITVDGRKKGAQLSLCPQETLWKGEEELDLTHTTDYAQSEETQTHHRERGRLGSG